MCCPLSIKNKIEMLSVIIHGKGGKNGIRREQKEVIEIMIY